MSTPLTPGQVLFERTGAVDRARLVRYAGASRGFNPIHWNERFAREVGLDGVIAHGMLTMGIAAGVLEEWVGDPGRITSYSTRFSRPVPVPDPGVGGLAVSGRGGAGGGDGTVRVDLTVTCEGRAVLAKAQAVVAPPR